MKITIINKAIKLRKKNNFHSSKKRKVMKKSKVKYLGGVNNQTLNDQQQKSILKMAWGIKNNNLSKIPGCLK